MNLAHEALSVLHTELSTLFSLLRRSQVVAVKKSSM